MDTSVTRFARSQANCQARPCLLTQRSIFLRRNCELSSSVPPGSHAYKSSSWNLHNCNFTLQILLGSFYAWFSQQLLLGVEASTNYFKHLTEICKPYLIKLLHKKKRKRSHGLEDEGTEGFCVGFFPPFRSPLLFKSSTCKTFVKPTQLQGPLTRPALSAQYPF